MPTTIPRVYDATVELFVGALPQSRVDDGMPVEWPEITPDRMQTGVIVGWAYEDESAMQAAIQYEGLDHRGRERYRIRGVLYASWGDPNLAPLRARTFDMYEAVRQALRDQHPIAEGVLTAQMELVEFHQIQTQEGPSVELKWELAIDAFEDQMRRNRHAQESTAQQEKPRSAHGDHDSPSAAGARDQGTSRRRRRA